MLHRFDVWYKGHDTTVHAKLRKQQVPIVGEITASDAQEGLSLAEEKYGIPITDLDVTPVRLVNWETDQTRYA